MDILKTEHLKKIYKRKVVVKDVSFVIRSAEIVGLLGPNGAGKTTSFYMTLGMVSLDGGQIFLNDKEITNLTIHERARLGIGYLPQEPSIFRKLSVAENIMAVLELRKNLSQEKRWEICNGLLEEFHIDSIRNNIGFSLSGGERRRVEIARALALEPKFILLDEPFAGIDPISVIDIKHIIHQLCERKIGVLITDHNVRETLDICHRAYIVNAGEIIAEGTPKDILNDQQVRKVYLGENFNI
ncbi:MAG: LPS export ABC transporter ATP-binding protein [Gammaproteobacteria bacterium]|nr:LPS export ABC transporter ATP-binding protein [Gammaproteobacteria bacterium]